MNDELNPDVYPDTPMLPLEWNSYRFTPRWAMTPEDVPEWDATRGGMEHVTPEEQYLFESASSWLASCWAQWRKIHPDVVISDAPIEHCPRLVETGLDWTVNAGLSQMSNRTMNYNALTGERAFTYTDVDTTDLLPALSRIWTDYEVGALAKARSGILELARNFSPYVTTAGVNATTFTSWLVFAQRVNAVLAILGCLEHEPDDFLGLLTEKRKGDMLELERVRPQQAWYELHGKFMQLGQLKLSPARIKSVLVDRCTFWASESPISFSSQDGVPKLTVIAGTGEWAMFLLARHIQRKSNVLVITCLECGTPVPSSARGQPKKWCSVACEIRNRRKRNAPKSVSKIATTVPPLTPNKPRSKPVKP